MNSEEWKAVPGFEGWYEVSSHGRVRSWYSRGRGKSKHIRSGKPFILRPCTTTKGDYKQVVLVLGNKKSSFRVHSLVALAFIGSRPDGMDVCHWDGNPSNNNLENLRYDTRAGNEADKKRYG